MRRAIATLGFFVVMFMLVPASAFAQNLQSSMELTLTVVARDSEPAFMLDGIQVIILLGGLGLALVLTSTVLKAMYSRHRG